MSAPPFICPTCRTFDADQFATIPPESGALVVCMACDEHFRAVAVTYINAEGVGIKIAAEPADEDWIPEHVLREDFVSLSEFYLLDGIWMLGLHPLEWLELGDAYRSDAEARSRLTFPEYVEERRPRKVER